MSPMLKTILMFYEAKIPSVLDTQTVIYKLMKRFYLRFYYPTSLTFWVHLIKYVNGPRQQDRLVLTDSERTESMVSNYTD